MDACLGRLFKFLPKEIHLPIIDGLYVVYLPLMFSIYSMLCVSRINLFMETTCSSVIGAPPTHAKMMSSCYINMPFVPMDWQHIPKNLTAREPYRIHYFASFNYLVSVFIMVQLLPIAVLKVTRFSKDIIKVVGEIKKLTSEVVYEETESSLGYKSAAEHIYALQKLTGTKHFYAYLSFKAASFAAIAGCYMWTNFILSDGKDFLHNNTIAKTVTFILKQFNMKPYMDLFKVKKTINVFPRIFLCDLYEYTDMANINLQTFTCNKADNLFHDHVFWFFSFFFPALALLKLLDLVITYIKLMPCLFCCKVSKIVTSNGKETLSIPRHLFLDCTVATTTVLYLVYQTVSITRYQKIVLELLALYNNKREENAALRLIKKEERANKKKDLEEDTCENNELPEVVIVGYKQIGDEVINVDKNYDLKRKLIRHSKSVDPVLEKHCSRLEYAEERFGSEAIDHVLKNMQSGKQNHQCDNKDCACCVKEAYIQEVWTKFATYSARKI